jgi:hypothetical protein
MDLTTMTPAEIDELWAPIQSREAQARSERYLLREQLHNAEVAEKRGLDKLSNWNRRSVESALAERPAQIQKATEAMDAAIAEQSPFRTEWNRRGGWTRAYLVITNGKGHVHRSMSCSTCYVTTQFGWLTECSGMNEQEIVDAAGERACTVCYASAPVELRLDRKTTLFSEDEKRKAAERAEREEKRRQADAAKITVEGYIDFGRSQTKVFKTVRAVTNAIASELGYLVWLGAEDGRGNDHINNVEVLRAALAAKGIEYDYDKTLATQRKKFERESGRPAKY